MGVPAFFRWLSEKYPKALIPVHEGSEAQVADTNALCDHLYVDMNGIIHPCAHPEDRPAPKSESEMFENVLRYVDRLVAATRPTTLVYLAVDGVAPRAKMNQQRARRWKAAKEAAEKREAEAEIRAELTGGSAVSSEDDSDAFDSNVITPGTQFMSRLASHVRRGVAERQARGDAYWRDAAVIISDAAAPGEGEHKIMAFVRQLRIEPNYDPNTAHVLHGLDADLIMLALATHEVDFNILREEVVFGRQAKQYEEATKMQRDAHAKLLAAQHGQPAEAHWVYAKPLQILKIATLREYLRVEFDEVLRQATLSEKAAQRAGSSSEPSSPRHKRPRVVVGTASQQQKKKKKKKKRRSQGEEQAQKGTGAAQKHRASHEEEEEDMWCSQFSFERAVDDFVFLCFFCGNDFIPHLPSLDIREGALDMLLNVYKTTLPSLGGHVTADGGKIELARLGELLRRVGRVEDEIFKRRRKSEDDANDRRKMSSQNRRRHHNGGGYSPNGPTIPLNASPDVVKSAVDKLLAEREARKLDTCAETFVDDVRLGDDGWKERYYGVPFKKRDIALGGGKDNLFKEYLKGLDWVLRYYYDGCASWGWFFPFHYAPFASDLADFVETLVDGERTRAKERLLCNVDDDDNASDDDASDDSKNSPTTTMFLQDVVSRDVDVGRPLTPLEQLMAVLPAASAKALPAPCRALMLDKTHSPIRDFYPDDVDVDPNGKAMPWLHVVLLPFVDEQRLLRAIRDALENAPNDDAAFVAEATKKRDAVVLARRDHGLAPRLLAPDAPVDPRAPTLLAGQLSRLDDTVENGGDGGKDSSSGEDSSGVSFRSLFFAASSSSSESAFATRARAALAVATLKHPLRGLATHESRLLDGAVAPPNVLTDPADRVPRPAPRLGRRDSSANVADLGLSSKGMHAANAGGPNGQRSWGSLEPHLLKKKHHHHHHNKSPPATTISSDAPGLRVDHPLLLAAKGTTTTRVPLPRGGIPSAPPAGRHAFAHPSTTTTTGSVGSGGGTGYHHHHVGGHHRGGYAPPPQPQRPPDYDYYQRQQHRQPAPYPSGGIEYNHPHGYQYHQQVPHHQHPQGYYQAYNQQAEAYRDPRVPPPRAAPPAAGGYYYGGGGFQQQHHHAAGLNPHAAAFQYQSPHQPPVVASAYDNAASANSLKEQLAQALRQRDYGGGRR